MKSEFVTRGRGPPVACACVQGSQTCRLPRKGFLASSAAKSAEIPSPEGRFAESMVVSYDTG
jgi:hypothetical protein